MEEFVFGTLATDSLKLLHHRVSHQGLQHAHALTPHDPKPGQPVTLTVMLGPDTGADHIAAYYTLDGSIPAGRRGAAENGYVAYFEQVDTVWDTATYGYLTRWQTTLPAQPEGAVVRYRIGAWEEDGTSELFADWPNVKDTAEHAVIEFGLQVGQAVSSFEILGRPKGDVFTYHVDRLAPPQWARDAVIYHIFVDRFYPGDGQGWRQTKNLQDSFGGTLWGVRDKLDYIADLGATAIWLSPIFPSPTYHGYDATDYRQVSAHLGGNAALHSLVEAAHTHGIRIILDLVCNHISHKHPLFLAAQNDPDSPYRTWFTFDDSRVGYRTFFGVHSMPQLNMGNPDARQWMIDLGRHWLRAFDVDGFRLDHANGNGPDFWSDFRAGCRAEKPDCFCFGEVVEPPDVLRAYAGRLDGCLDFMLEDALRKTFAFGTWAEAAFERFTARHLAYFPDDFLLPTFLDNHDMDRFLFVADNNKGALRRAAAVQMRLPGPPIIYYGTEVGMTQPASKDGGLTYSRLPMLWGDAQDKELLAFYKKIIRTRVTSHPEGNFTTEDTE